MSSKLPIKSIPWFEKLEKHTLLFQLLLCLLNHRYWESIVDETKSWSSSAKCFCKVVHFSNKILGNIKGSIKFEIFSKNFTVRERGIIFHLWKFISNKLLTHGHCRPVILDWMSTSFKMGVYIFHLCQNC